MRAIGGLAIGSLLVVALLVPLGASRAAPQVLAARFVQGPGHQHFESCAEFGGMEHTAGDGVCCAADCGEFCGGSKSHECDHGPGGGDACCASHIEAAGHVCGHDERRAPCLLQRGPAPAPPAPSPAIHSDFTSREPGIWKYADHELAHVEDGYTYYLLNHSTVDSTLSLGQGHGLRMVISDEPCKSHPRACAGAKMASDHVMSVTNHLYGDFELRFRPPFCSDGADCPPDIFACM